MDKLTLDSEIVAGGARLVEGLSGEYFQRAGSFLSGIDDSRQRGVRGAMNAALELGVQSFGEHHNRLYQGLSQYSSTISQAVIDTIAVTEAVGQSIDGGFDAVNGGWW